MAKLVYQRKNGKWEARYKKGRSSDGRIIYGTVYGDTKEEAISRRNSILGKDFEYEGIPKQEMNLLIIGAGIHGRDCFEIAKSLRIFKEIKFLDDVVVNEDVIGKTSDIEKMRYKYPCAFVAIGDNNTRKSFVERLKKSCYLLPSIISPYAQISPEALIGEGVVVFPNCTVNKSILGDFCIVDTNSLVNSGVELGAYTRVDCGAIVLKGVSTAPGTWIQSGEIFGK